MSPSTGRWREEIESPSATPLLDLTRVLVRGASVVIGAFAIIFGAFAANAGHDGQVAIYVLFLVVIAVANVAVELLIRRGRRRG